jgi:hypothetical protein
VEGALPALLAFPVEFVVSDKGNKVSSKEAFILTIVKIAKGYTNVDLAEHFGFSCDTVVSQIYRYTINLLYNNAGGLLNGGAACLQH